MTARMRPHPARRAGAIRSMCAVHRKFSWNGNCSSHRAKKLPAVGLLYRESEKSNQILPRGAQPPNTRGVSKDGTVRVDSQKLNP